MLPISTNSQRRYACFPYHGRLPAPASFSAEQALPRVAAAAYFTVYRLRRAGMLATIFKRFWHGRF